MTGFSSLINAVSGLQTQSARINNASQNIANANTTGYKEVDTNFANLIGGYFANSQDSGGVTSSVEEENNTQGDITPDSTPTNIAISGSGFFAVTTAPSATGAAASNGLAYTRDGDFAPDKNGDLVNNAGYYLQGWALNPDGTVPTGASESTLTTVSIPQTNGKPTATSLLSIKANLDSSQAVYSGTPPYNAADPTANMASGAVEPQFTETVPIIDSTGAAHQATIGFLKTGTNTWATEVYAQTPSDIAGGNPQIASGTLAFNGDGTLASISPSLTQPMAVSWTTAGADPSSISVSWGTAGPVFGTPGATVIGRSDGMEQLDSTSQNNGITNNGVQVGSLVSVAVNKDGFLVGTYSNGASQNLYMIPVARFLDPTQLAAISNTAFGTTQDSSAAEYVQPGTEESGQLDGSALESSSTDEDTDLTTLIIAQQSYQFNSKLITTQDSMLQDLTQMVV